MPANRRATRGAAHPGALAASRRHGRHGWQKSGESRAKVGRKSGESSACAGRRWPPAGRKPPVAW
ncbi:hypothetical protein EFP18_10360 [Burkholderia glumae]|nr:hypothetical protein EFP18_10360 [Burkholderia glumae]